MNSTGKSSSYLKELCHGNFIHFAAVKKKYFLIEGNLPIIVSSGRKTSKKK